MALNQSGASLGGSDISLYLISYFETTIDSPQIRLGSLISAVACQYQSLPLYGGRWLGTNVIHDATHIFYLIDDST